MLRITFDVCAHMRAHAFSRRAGACAYVCVRGLSHIHIDWVSYQCVCETQSMYVCVREGFYPCVARAKASDVPVDIEACEESHSNS